MLIVYSNSLDNFKNMNTRKLAPTIYYDTPKNISTSFSTTLLKVQNPVMTILK